MTIIDKYNIDVDKALFIGNDSSTDIKGAKNVNLDTFYVKSNISPKDDSGKENQTDAFCTYRSFVVYRKL